jgi:RNA polymerase sigma-70 factor (ECF subfamily)
MVQETLIVAWGQWSFGVIPDNPSAWVMTVARRKLLNYLRREKLRDRLVGGEEEPAFTELDLDEAFRESEVGDAQLRMMFACCHPELPVESQIAITLKILCGFGTREIAAALLAQEDAVEKRLTRAKQTFRERNLALEIPGGAELEERLQSVHLCIYLLFNEGYNASHSDTLSRKDLCSEALRLCGLVAERFPGETAPWALMALMCLHAARFDSRLDDRGALVIFSRQDRSRWNRDLINRGLEHLAAAAQGNILTEYHLEAFIAAEHCTAADFESTNWKALDRFYALLGAIKDNPVIDLNRAVILSYTSGPEAAVAVLENLRAHPRLNQYYLLHATLGDLHARMGHAIKARDGFARALDLTASRTEQEYLRGRIAALG